jgi:hypothetical protein
MLVTARLITKIKYRINAFSLRATVSVLTIALAAREVQH